MKRQLPDLPSFYQVSTELDGHLGRAYRALRQGAKAARAFFWIPGRDVDPNLFPQLVRYYAKLELLGAGEQVHDEPDDAPAEEEGIDYELERLANNGLCVHAGRYSIRVLKAAPNGGLPNPGKSERKKKFYRQEAQLPLPLDPDDLHEPDDAVNLILVWDVDRHTWELSSMSLACPTGYSETLRRVRTAWNEPLKQFVEGSKVPPNLGVESNREPRLLPDLELPAEVMSDR